MIEHSPKILASEEKNKQTNKQKKTHHTNHHHFHCFCGVSLIHPQWELLTQKLKSHQVRTRSLNVLPLKPRVRQHIDIHATLTAKDIFLAYFYLPVHSPAFFSKTSPDFFSCVDCG